jgi:hypothetical protein
VAARLAPGAVPAWLVAGWLVLGWLVAGWLVLGWLAARCPADVGLVGVSMVPAGLLAAVVGMGRVSVGLVPAAWLAAGRVSVGLVPAGWVVAGPVPAGLMPSGGLPGLVSAGLPTGLVWAGLVSTDLVPVGACAAPQPEHGARRNPLGRQGRVWREDPSIGCLQLPPGACRTTLTWIQAHPGQQIRQEAGHGKVGREVNLMPAERAHHDDPLAQVGTGARLSRAVAIGLAAILAQIHATELGGALNGRAKIPVGAGFHARPPRAADGHV